MPTCLNAWYEPLVPGQFRCVANVLIDAVPPGMGGNPGPVPIPLYGPCHRLFDEQSGAAAAVAFTQAQTRANQVRQAQANAAARYAEEQEELQQRQIRALMALKAAGNPGLRPRRILTGAIKPPMLGEFLGWYLGRRTVSVLPVDAEPAWPLGKFTWLRNSRYGEVDSADLDTGFTPTERIVPLEFGTSGDAVREHYPARSMWSNRDSHMKPGRAPSLRDIVVALERNLTPDEP